ncbi:S8 family peptidase [Methanogenium cariaci]
MKHSKTLLFLFILVLCAGFCATSAVAGLSPEFISSSATDSIRFSSAGDEENSVVMPEPVLKKEIISPDRRYVPGVVILVYDLPEMAATGPEHIISASVNAGIGAVVTESYVTGVLPGYQVVSLPEGMSVDEALIYYGNQPGVAYAQPDFIYAMDTVPDDPLYGLQWGLQNTGQGTPQFPSGGTVGADIRAEDAWDITTGSDTVVIAVIDTGVDYLHADLVANMWDDGSGHSGYDFVNNDDDPMDDNSHGTHCAGIIAAVGNNGVGVSGVCWDTRIMALKVLNADGVGTTTDEIAAINYAVTHGADILSCSWGGTDYDPALKTAIDNSSLLTVCAAGNDGTDNDAVPHYPSNFISPNILSVAATAPDDNLSSFSNYGATSVDVGAPGTDIYSTIPREVSIGTTRYSDNFSSLDGWFEYDHTGSGRKAWHLDNTTYTSAPSSATIGPYENNWDQWLIKQDSISLAGLTDPVLRYQWSVDTQINSDFGYVGISEDQSSFSFIGGSGNTGGFIEQTYDLTNFSGKDYSGKTIWIAYRLVSDASTTGRGIWVDDIQIGELDGPVTSVYGYMSGTSMATPMVSGMAGLLLAENSSYTFADLKAAVMDSTDSLPALAGKCVSGGRGNASAALTPAPPPVGPPSVSGIVPSTGLDSGLTYISALTGTNFTGDMTVQLTRTGETAIPAEYVYTENTTHARCAFNGAGAPAGAWDVSTTTVGGSATLPAAFMVTVDTSSTDTAIIPVEPGWNMVSAPRQGPAMDLTNTTPGTLYCYDPIQGKYMSCSVDDIIPGRGYWIFAPSSTDISATGYTCPTYQYEVHPGWNLIGSIQTPVATGNITLVPDSLILVGQVYAYDPGTGQYTDTTSLTPGKAYWMAFSGDGVMILG